MAKQFPALTEDQQQFISEQHIFFTASASPDGRVNVSPKGMDSLRILGPGRILWLNLTGSGNETAGHLLESPRVTLMWCSFSKRPMILRAYGTARAIHSGDADWASMITHFPPNHAARQVFDLSLDLVQTSCGYAVPFMEFAGERDTLTHWASNKTEEDIQTYWRDRNTKTIDGKPTGVPLK